MPFLLLASVITLKRFDSIRAYRGCFKQAKITTHDFKFPRGKPHYF